VYKTNNCKGPVFCATIILSSITFYFAEGNETKAEIWPGEVEKGGVRSRQQQQKQQQQQQLHQRGTYFLLP